MACEVLTATRGAKNILRRKDGHHLRTVIDTGKKYGMCSMVDSIEKLLEENLITELTAKRVMGSYT